MKMTSNEMKMLVADLMRINLWGDMEFKDNRGDVYYVCGTEDNPINLELPKLKIKLVRKPEYLEPADRVSNLRAFLDDYAGFDSLKQAVDNCIEFYSLYDPWDVPEDEEEKELDALRKEFVKVEDKRVLQDFRLCLDWVK
jgi:hypothetical protein